MPRGMERFGEFGEGVLMRKNKTRLFYLGMGRQKYLPGSSSAFEEPAPGGEPLFFFCTEGSWEEGVGVLLESLVCDT